MFGPQHYPALIRYFDGIDIALSRRLLRKTPPDETSMTNELCALMDGDTQREENLLDFNLDQLNAALAACGDGLTFDVTIDTYPHTSAMEAYVSQADLGLIIEYRNRVLPKLDWSVAHLIQSKRVFRSRTTNTYDHRSRFESVDVGQHQAIERVAAVLGPDVFRYGLYCPPTCDLEPAVRTQFRALHTRNLEDHIFDYSFGLAQKDWLLRIDGRIDAGIWITPVELKPTTLGALHSEAMKHATPLTWFILGHFSRGMHFGSRPRIGSPDDLAHRVVRGDEAAIEELLERLGYTEEPRVRVLPRHTMTVRVEVARDLPDGIGPAIED